MHDLVGEEADADEAFWGQSAFQENNEDGDYAFVDQEDIVDSDIDLSEGDEPEAEEVRPEAKKKPSKAYREPASIRALKSRLAKGKHSTGTKRKRGSSAKSTTESSMSLRQSTKRITQQVAEKAVRGKTSTGRKGYGEKTINPDGVKFARLTQEEMLMAAVVTEQENKMSLKSILRASAKTKGMKAPKGSSGVPVIRYHSRKDPAVHTLTFTEVSRVPAAINSTTCAYRKRSGICVVTGLPGRYRDPLTGSVYANLEAFRELRRRYEIEHRKQSEGETKEDHAQSGEEREK